MPATNDPKIIVVTGAASGFGAMRVRALGRSGHSVYAGMRGTTDHNTSAGADLEVDAKDAGSDLRAIEMDVSEQGSVDHAINQIIAACGRLDVRTPPATANATTLTPSGTAPSVRSYSIVSDHSCHPEQTPPRPRRGRSDRRPG